MPSHINQVNVRSEHLNQVLLDPHEGTKSIPIPALKSANFDLHYKIKSILMPRHQKNVNFDLYNPPHKPSQFRSKHWNQVISDPHTKTTSIPIPVHKKSISIPILKPG